MTDIGILYSYLEEEHGHQYIYYPIEYFKTPEDPLAYNTTAKRFAQDIIHDHWENANTLTPIEHYRYCLGIIKFDDQTDIKNTTHLYNKTPDNIHYLAYNQKCTYNQFGMACNNPKDNVVDITYNQHTNTYKVKTSWPGYSENELPCVCRRCLPEDTTYNCREEFPTQYNFLIAIPEDILNNK